ncbi:ParH-like protein [Streptomyces sp. SP17BM10]|uniref:ParH-like protein n=1 Tax=Streptomyces sp. SP17BM10 TaxID=3002530 RepID=UPI002E76BCA3|nr:ParH-like protein [Streptomyces sp. SP17BM10]MEE1781759.1 ParH-like protein [Streptomyces sp. SP17BM10]
MRVAWGGGDGYRAVLRRCRRMAQELDLPAPFDPAVLLDRLAARRGRPIELVPVAARPNLPCGLLVSTAEADYILYAADTSPLHRRHILVHEIAHLLFDHAGSAPITPVSSQALLPHLSPALVQRVLGRTGYDEPQEREAELLASLILSRAAKADAAARPGSTPALDTLLSAPPPSGSGSGSESGGGGGGGRP